MKEFLAFLLGLTILTAGGSFLIINAPGKVNVEQPIAFNHQKHTTFLQCTFCHQSVQDSAVATIPQATKCMTCHQSKVTENPEPEKIKLYFNAQEEIPWVRLFALADDIVFSHKAHIRGNVECSSCHGDVSNTAKITKGFGTKGIGGPRGRELMNFCMDCHKKREANTDCLTCHK